MSRMQRSSYTRALSPEEDEAEKAAESAVFKLRYFAHLYGAGGIIPLRYVDEAIAEARRVAPHLSVAELQALGCEAKVLPKAEGQNGHRKRQPKLTKQEIDNNLAFQKILKAAQLVEDGRAATEAQIENLLRAVCLEEAVFLKDLLDRKQNETLGQSWKEAAYLLHVDLGLKIPQIWKVLRRSPKDIKEGLEWMERHIPLDASFRLSLSSIREIYHDFSSV